MKTKQTTAEQSSITTLEALALAINANESKVESIDAKIAPSIEKKKKLDEETKELRAQLAEAMKNQARHNIFVGGFQFTMKHNPPSFSVLNDTLAQAWAVAHDCVKIDMPKAKTLLKREIMTPSGFVREDSITVSRTQEKSA